MKTNILSIDSFNIPIYLNVSAWVEHVPFAFELIKRAKPRLLVELGTHYGVSYFSFCQSVKENNLYCTCYAVDKWLGDEHAGLYGEDVFAQVTSHNNEHYAGFSHLMRSTFEDAVIHFSDSSIDLLHIDGLHTYTAVKRDFETWLPKLSDAAILLFHDISVRDGDFGVFQLWEELSLLYPSFSFEHGSGLGVLAVGKNIPKEMEGLFLYKTEEEIQEIRYCYHRLGRYLTEKWSSLQIVEYLYSLIDRATGERDTLAFELEQIRKKLGSD